MHLNRNLVTLFTGETLEKSLEGMLMRSHDFTDKNPNFPYVIIIIIIIIVLALFMTV